MNWYLLDERQDPGHQLEWLENLLEQIESNEGFAIIIAHIPTYDCLHQFGLRYKALVERYQHIVRFSIFGHTHYEDLNIVQAINTTQPIGFNLISASGTSWTTMKNGNPSFTVIDFDEEYMVPINTHTYFLNLTEANEHRNTTPTWKEQHDMLKEYNLEDMSPSSMLALTERIFNEQEVASQYSWNRNRRGGGSPLRPVAALHDVEQKCRLQSSEDFELKDCKGKKHIDLLHPDLNTFSDWVIGNWVNVSPKE